MNAWDTPVIYHDLKENNERRQYRPMPPLSNITIASDDWFHKQFTGPPAIHNEPKQDAVEPVPTDNNVPSAQNTSADFKDDGEDQKDQEQNSDVNMGPDDSHNEPSHAETTRNDDTQVQVENELQQEHEHKQEEEPVVREMPEIPVFVNVWDDPQNEPPSFESLSVERQQEAAHVHDYYNQFTGMDEYTAKVEDTSAFPWESYNDTTPTRVWLNEPPEKPASETESQDNWVSVDRTDYSGGNGSVNEEESPHSSSQEELTTSADPDPVPPQEEQSQDPIIDSPVPSTIEPSETVNEPVTEGNVYAMDLIPSTPSPRRAATLPNFFDDTREPGNDWSDRDLIPLPLKPSSKLLLSGYSSPNPYHVTMPTRYGGYTSNSRRHSFHEAYAGGSSSKSPSGSMPTSPRTFKSTKTEEKQTHRLFASGHSTYSKTPYTSAAATPTKELEFFLPSSEETETDPADSIKAANPKTVFDFESYNIDLATEKLRHRRSSGSSPPKAMISDQFTAADDHWDTEQALARLRDHSETLLFHKTMDSLKEKEKEKEKAVSHHAVSPPAISPSSPSPSVNEVPVDISPAAWDMGEPASPIEWPMNRASTMDGIISGTISPRTPVAEKLESNLTQEIEETKRLYRQRTNYALNASQVAHATILETEFDLSKSLLFERRVKNAQPEVTPPVDQPYITTETPKETDTFAAFFSEDIMKEARQRLLALAAERNEEAISEKEKQTFTQAFATVVPDSNMSGMNMAKDEMQDVTAAVVKDIAENDEEVDALASVEDDRSSIASVMASPQNNDKDADSETRLAKSLPSAAVGLVGTTATVASDSSVEERETELAADPESLPSQKDQQDSLRIPDADLPTQDTASVDKKEDSCTNAADDLASATQAKDQILEVAEPKSNPSPESDELAQDSLEVSAEIDLSQEPIKEPIEEPANNEPAKRDIAVAEPQVLEKRQDPSVLSAQQKEDDDNQVIDQASITASDTVPTDEPCSTAASVTETNDDADPSVLSAQQKEAGDNQVIDQASVTASDTAPKDEPCATATASVTETNDDEDPLVVPAQQKDEQASVTVSATEPTKVSSATVAVKDAVTEINDDGAIPVTKPGNMDKVPNATETENGSSSVDFPQITVASDEPAPAYVTVSHQSQSSAPLLLVSETDGLTDVSDEEMDFLSAVDENELPNDTSSLHSGDFFSVGSSAEDDDDRRIELQTIAENEPLSLPPSESFLTSVP
ncbi:uncharacterized protein BYT42DRAFT_233897 [Radiomyces spectabilis]|uniref:uncharacterized protein n=1 Tax=Radiomyces spectabilis TaxID=64574 RepID=UPI0022212A97|nr:uncharacterized protein BYT42DRAFT_233897 [Radiomyces spectabilis]KAI8388410.1 hypothetical protein BYT42DRAFT_233897 [Radiomyces spectabilis]